MIPMNYFWATRLTDRRSWASMLGFEWGPQLLAIWLLSTASMTTASLHFALAYLAFISIYEIGYLTNDIISVRFEEEPRRRMAGREPTVLQFGLWVLGRLTAFTGLTFFMGLQGEWWWWGFFGALSLVFMLHNALRDASLRVVSFVGLATGRAIAPLLPFLTFDILRSLLIPILLNYVLFRTLAYMDSKDLLDMPNRQSTRFRIGFYAVLIPLSAMIAIIDQSPLALAVNGYYLLFWSLLGFALIFRRNER